MLDSFIAGFTGDLHRQALDKEKLAADLEKTKREEAQRRKERREMSKERTNERQAIRQETEAAEKVGEGYNPETGVIEYMQGGEIRSRQATTAEARQYEAEVAAAQRAGLLDELKQREIQSNIGMREARAALSNRTDPNIRSGGDDALDKPISENAAKLIARSKLGPSASEKQVEAAAGSIVAQGLTRRDLQSMPALKQDVRQIDASHPISDML